MFLGYISKCINRYYKYFPIWLINCLIVMQPNLWFFFLLAPGWQVSKNHSLWENCLHWLPALFKTSLYLNLQQCGFPSHTTELALAKRLMATVTTTFMKSYFLLFHMIPYCTYFAPCFLTTSLSTHSFNSKFLIFDISQSLATGPHLSSFHTHCLWQ